jgi:hypothetical protein
MSGRLAAVRDERADRDPELAGDLLAVLDVLGGTGIPLACIPACVLLSSAAETGLSGRFWRYVIERAGSSE